MASSLQHAVSGLATFAQTTVDIAGMNFTGNAREVDVRALAFDCARTHACCFCHTLRMQLLHRNMETHRWQIEDQRWEIEDVRRLIDEKSQQLKSISHLSALLAGFSMVCMVEVQIPADTHQAILICFGGFCSVVVGLMLMAMVNCTLILNGILGFDFLQVPATEDPAHRTTPRRRFQTFWDER